MTPKTFKKWLYLRPPFWCRPLQSLKTIMTFQHLIPFIRWLMPFIQAQTCHVTVFFTSWAMASLLRILAAMVKFSGCHVASSWLEPRCGGHNATPYAITGIFHWNPTERRVLNWTVELDWNYSKTNISSNQFLLKICSFADIWIDFTEFISPCHQMLSLDHYFTTTKLTEWVRTDSFIRL